MPNSLFAARAGGILAITALACSVTACAAEPELSFAPPTMAPDQSVVEACAISGDQINQLTAEAEQQIRDGIEQAGADLTSGKVPRIELFSDTFDSTLAGLEAQISNYEVVTAINDVRTAAQGFSDIHAPDSLLGAPGYVTALVKQSGQLADAGKALQALCNAG
jgi:hypothetical protein